jgi:hypothetical protein
MQQFAAPDKTSYRFKNNNFFACFNKKALKQLWDAPLDNFLVPLVCVEPILPPAVSITNKNIKEDSLYNLIENIEQLNKQTQIPWLHTMIARDRVHLNSFIIPSRTLNLMYIYDLLIKRIEILDPALFSNTLKSEVATTRAFINQLPQKNNDNFLTSTSKLLVWSSKTWFFNRYQDSYGTTTIELTADSSTVTDFMVRKLLMNSVIAHEIGHTQQITEEVFKTGCIDVITSVFEKNLGNVAQSLLSSSCSQHLEYDADKFATMHGYGQATTFMFNYVFSPTITSELIFKESSAGDFYLKFISYFKSHPTKNDRIAAIKKTINQYPKLQSLINSEDKNEEQAKNSFILTEHRHTNFFYRNFNHYIMRLFNCIALNEIVEIKNEVYDFRAHCAAVAQDTKIILNEIYISEHGISIVIQPIPVLNTLLISTSLLGMINSINPALFTDDFKSEVMQKQNFNNLEEVTHIACKIHLLRSLFAHHSNFLTKFVKNEQNISLKTRLYNFSKNVRNSLLSAFLLIIGMEIILKNISTIPWVIQFLGWNVQTARNQEADRSVAELGYGEGYKFALQHGFTDAPPVYNFMKEEQVGLELQRYSQQFLGWRVPTQTRMNILDEHIGATSESAPINEELPPVNGCVRRRKPTHKALMHQAQAY